MKQVIRLEEEKKKPIEFTHYQTFNGWQVCNFKDVYKVEKIRHLGKCVVDGDIFAVYNEDGSIDICRGHLNDGVY